MRDQDKTPKTPPASRLPAPVDHEVRPTSKPSMSPREREIRDECRLLGEIQWDKIADRLCAAYRADRSGSTVPDGRPSQTLSTDIPAADPEALTPTESAVNARLFAGTGSKEEGDKTGKLERDPFHEAFQHARSALGQAALAVEPIMNHLNRCEEIRKPDKVNNNAPKCEEPTCNDDAAKGERGRCHACYCWLLANKTEDGQWPARVDPDVIEARRRRREKAA